MTRRKELWVIAALVGLAAACAIPPVDREGSGGGGATREAGDPDDDPRIRLYPGDDEGGGSGTTDPSGNDDAGSGGGTDPTGNGAPPPSGGSCGMNDFESEVLRLVNEQRASAGLAPYACHDGLGTLAREHSRDMCDRDFSGHTNPDGMSPFDRIAAAGISTTTAGENVAAGQTSPDDVMRSWMGSSGHRANIMSSSFEKIGVGYASCSTARFPHYWTQVFGAGVQP